jgi:hypothetical protein
MGKSYEHLDDTLKHFIGQQPMYFVATAPTEGGHVNLSPKGYAETFAIIDDHTVAYLNGTALRACSPPTTPASAPSS